MRILDRNILFALALGLLFCHPVLALAQSTSSTSSVGGLITGTDVTATVKNTSTALITWFIIGAVTVAVGGVVFLGCTLMMGEDRFPKQRAINFFAGIMFVAIGIFAVGKVFNGLGTSAAALTAGAGGNSSDSSGSTSGS